MPLPRLSPAARRAVRAAVRDAFGLPGLILFASYVGFGSLVRESGLGLAHGLASTATGWALPGQVALVELHAVGASAAAIGVAVLLTNMRLMPMVITLLPLVRRPGAPRWRLFALAHGIAVTTWANGLRRLPDMASEDRFAWMAAFCAALMVYCLVGTAAGFFLAGMAPRPVTLGLVFLNPIYFMLLFAADMRQRARALALGFGAVCGPLLHLATPGYGLLITGVVAGTAAFAVDERLRRREERAGHG